MLIGIKQFKKETKGSALILTIFIMAGMLLAAMGGAYVSLLGIRASGLQADSTKAYYAAESGSEELLYKVKTMQDTYDGANSTLKLLSSLEPFVYTVYYQPDYDGSDKTLLFRSVGQFLNTYRSVEIRFGEN